MEAHSHNRQFPKFPFIRLLYLFGPTQGRGPGEQDGPLGALNQGRQNLCPRRVPGLEVVRLVHHDHGEALPTQSVHQGARVRGEQAVAEHRHLTAGDAPVGRDTHTHTQFKTHCK